MAKGIATPKDKCGNDEGDNCATKGVVSIGLANATKWLSIRHNGYKALLERIHVMIIKVLQTEKDVKTARIAAKKFVAGYDETKFVKTDGSIKGPEMFQGPAKRLNLKPPVVGHHRLSNDQELYEDASKFLSDLSWRTPDEETRASGTTWLELFILFDTTGYRRKGGRTKKDADAAERAERRKARNKHQRKGNRATETADVRASLSDELAAFKKVVRHIARQDADPDQAKWFHADEKPQYRRLKHLGVVEHQPAIAANCEGDPATMKEVGDPIVAQKARCTPKQLKHYREAKESDDQSGTFLIRKAKVDVRSCPKWKRSEVDGTKADDSIGVVGQPDIGQPTYSSRKLICLVCDDQIETAQMQLFTLQGFRNINCSRCAAQRRTKGWKCECGVAWHTCEIHRKDPTVHRSTKPQRPKKKVDEIDDSYFKDSERKAPESVQSLTNRPQKKIRTLAKLHPIDCQTSRK